MNNALAMLRRHRAMLDAEGGSWLEARAALDELALRLRERTDTATQYELGRTLLDRATVLGFANRWQDALEDLAECERLALGMLPVSRNALLVNVYGQRLKLYAASWSPIRDPVEARRALECLRAVGSSGWWIDEAGADLAYQEQDWEAAERAYRQLERALESEGWQRGVAASRIRIGRCLVELGRVKEAGEVLELALERLRGTGARHLLASAHLQKARVVAALSDPEGAWGLAQTALTLVESTVRRFRDIFDQQRFILEKAEFYEEAFDIGLACSGEAGAWRAWAVAERAKSFHLCQLLANADIPLFDGVSAADVSRLRDLEAQLDVAEAALSRTGSSEAERSRRAVHEQRVDSLSRAKLELQERMMRLNPRWGALRAPAAFEPAAELAKLSSEWLAISYFWRSRGQDSALHVFWHGADGRPRHVHDAWSRADLARLEQARSRMRGVMPPTSTLLDDGLSARLWPEALQAELTTARQLLISPHGRLERLPLHALRLASSDRVIERCAVQYLPSLALLPLRREAAGVQDVLLLGSTENRHGDRPLADIPRQLLALEQIWAGSGARQVVRKELSAKTTLADAGVPLAGWGRFDVVHLGCHGSFPEERPFDAALRLGAETLRASEFFAHPLAARMVALSACSLGRQADRHGPIELIGDEWIGLYLPLFYAGVRCMAVSLWDANAEVAGVVMKGLHGSLEAGDCPSRALRRAIAGVRTKPAALWANWCVVGFPD